MFTTCMFSLKLPCPLPPSNLTHSSPEGVAPSCQVKPAGDLVLKKMAIVVCLFQMMYLMCSDSLLATLAIRLGEQRHRQLLSAHLAFLYWQLEMQRAQHQLRGSLVWSVWQELSVSVH